MLPLLLLLLIAVPVLELYVILQVGSLIGALPTIGLLIAASVLGTVLLRSQGRRAWERFTLAVSEGRIPAREAIDGVLIIAGGALLLTPGFVSDVAGLLLLAPPTRTLARRVLVRRVTPRMVASGRVFPGARRPRRDRSWDVDGTAHEVDPRPRLQ